MQAGIATPGAEIIISRLRRLATIWRATYIVQMILLQLLVLAVALELSLPGVLRMLVRSDVGAQLLIPGILIPLLLLDPVAAYVELLIGRQLDADGTPLRKVLRILYMIPGMMLLRRSILLGLASLWLNIIIVALVVWFVGMVLTTVLMRIVEPVGQVFGKGVDVMDRLLSGVYSQLRKVLREIALSPASEVDNDDHIVIPLLAAKLERMQAKAPNA